MIDHWLDITDVPALGREFIFESPELWEQAWSEYHLDVRPETALTAKFSVVPDKRGAFIRGKLTGRVITSCDRCIEETLVEIDQDFDMFEELPTPLAEVLEPGLLRLKGKRLELDVGLMVWEEFLRPCRSSPFAGKIARDFVPIAGPTLILNLAVAGRINPTPVWLHFTG